MSYVKIGVGGPVGSGKTALIERLTRKMSKEYSIYYNIFMVNIPYSQ